eukprot:TRINITY_DN4631_c1_g1_i2.p1 TRINITY_DN4631_c1_g1~~TRINITY_DN4631_c1_g1_i2.p1  ORF type:complete len:522 (+),score=87.54 TRINITY_DN4631_c1_g1_i2:40-1605(+)
MDRTPNRRREKKRQSAAGGSGLSAVRNNGNSKRETLHKRWGAAYDRLCQIWDAFEVVQSERQNYAGRMLTTFTPANIELIEKEVAVLENIRKVRGLISETRNTRQQLLDRMTRLCSKLTIATDSPLFSNELHLIVRLLRVKARELMELWVALDVHVKPSINLPAYPYQMEEIVNDVADLIEDTPAKEKLGFNARANPFLHPSCPPKTGTEQLTQQEEVQIAKILRCLGKSMPYGSEWLINATFETESCSTSISDNENLVVSGLLSITVITVVSSVMVSCLNEKTMFQDAVNEEEVELTMETIEECTTASLVPTPSTFPNGMKRILSPLTPASVPPTEEPVVTSSTQQRRIQDRANTMRAIFDKGCRSDLPPLVNSFSPREFTPSKKRRGSTLHPAGPKCAIEVLRQVVTSERLSTVLSFMQASVEASVPDSHQHFHLLSQLFSKYNDNNVSSQSLVKLGRSESEDSPQEESRLSQVFRILNATKIEEEPFATTVKTRTGGSGTKKNSDSVAPILWRTLSAK